MTKWPWNVLTNEGEARILLAAALARAPSLRADGLTGEGAPPDLRMVAACHDFLFPVRLRTTIDDRRTAVEIVDMLRPWLESREVPGDVWHGALIAAALGKGADYLQCGISCFFNLRSRDVEDRLTSVSRQLAARR